MQSHVRALQDTGRGSRGRADGKVGGAGLTRHNHVEVVGVGLALFRSDGMVQLLCVHPGGAQRGTEHRARENRCRADGQRTKRLTVFARILPLRELPSSYTEATLVLSGVSLNQATWPTKWISVPFRLAGRAVPENRKRFSR